MDKPGFVYRDGMIADKDYVNWLSEVKHRFQQSQLKAAIRVNTAMLEFYWSIGRDLVRMRAEERWGTRVVKQFSLDMRNNFPNETGFSLSNVKYMKQWYSFYYERITKGQQLVGQFKVNKTLLNLNYETNPEKEFLKEEKEFLKDSDEFTKGNLKFRKEFLKAQRMIYSMISTKPETTIKEMSENIGISNRQTQKYIKKLTELKLIIREGGRKNGKWKIVDEEYEGFFDRI